MLELTGKIALVTGSSRGIGRAIALALAKQGVDVGINYRDRADDAEQVRKQIEKNGRRCVTLQADVSDPSQVARMVETVQKTMGSVSILVNNAGIARPRALEAITEADWDEAMEVNLKSVFLVTQAVLPGMRAGKWGRIINLSSAAVHVGGIIGPHYTASKAGVLGLTHAYASQLAREGITVNAIAPALIDTNMIAGNPKAQPERIPVGRFGTAEEVADAVIMLARNGFMTGQTLNLNGGMYMT